MRELLQRQGLSDGVVRRRAGRSVAAVGAAIAVLALQSGPATAASASFSNLGSGAQSGPSPSSVRLCRTPSGKTVTYHSLKPPAACKLQKRHG